MKKDFLGTEIGCISQGIQEVCFKILCVPSEQEMKSGVSEYLSLVRVLPV